LIRKIVFGLIAISCLMAFPISINAQYAPDVKIILASEIFHYGEKLDYTIIVSEVTGEDATIYIIDTSENRSPLVSKPISQEETRVLAPFSFTSDIWNVGGYSLELEYSGAVSKVDFTIIDDGSVGIPYWINDLAKLWLTMQIPDKEYAEVAIQYLIEQGMITNPEYGNTLYIPNWFKYTTAWWSTGEISDTTYAHAMQFLIDKKFMKIPFNQESSDLPSDSFL
jgi:hypothetical protein